MVFSTNSLKKFRGQRKLNFEYAPFGEYAADQTTSDDIVIQNESVFSKAAGIEGKLKSKV